MTRHVTTGIAWRSSGLVFDPTGTGKNCDNPRGHEVLSKNSSKIEKLTTLKAKSVWVINGFSIHLGNVFRFSTLGILAIGTYVPLSPRWRFLVLALEMATACFVEVFCRWEIGFLSVS